jgi:hypothetical protein
MITLLRLMRNLDGSIRNAVEVNQSRRENKEIETCILDWRPGVLQK